MAVNPQAATDPPARDLVRSEERCVRCEYNLQGLPLAGDCPECNTPIHQSVRGDLLIDADAGYVRRMSFASMLITRSGLVAFLTGLSVLIALFVTSSPFMTPVPPPMRVTLLMAGSIGIMCGGVMFWGATLLSCREPGRSHEIDTPGRRILRAGLVGIAGSLGVFLLSFLLERAASPGTVAGEVGAILQVVAALAGLASVGVAGAASLNVARHLAERAPDRRLVRDFQSLRRHTTGIAGASAVVLAINFVPVVTTPIMGAGFFRLVARIFLGLLSLYVLLGGAALLVEYPLRFGRLRRRLRRIVAHRESSSSDERER